MADERFPADQIKPLRERLGMTQAKFARAAGVDQMTVSRWERGARTLLQEETSRRIRRLAK